MTDDLDAKIRMWWTNDHKHTRRCWWNWEVGRWICGATGRTAAADEPEKAAVASPDLAIGRSTAGTG